MRRKLLAIGASVLVLGALAAATPFVLGAHSARASQPTYDINTLAGKVASVNGTAGLQIRFSAFIEEEANADPNGPIAADGATLAADGGGLGAGNIAVNQDTAGAPQNETSIAVDPNNPNRVVGSANDYVTRTWSCTVNGAPCSAQGDGYSGTYYSNDGGATWCCNASDPSHLGTLIPGVDHLAGGQYDAGGDPALAFDSRGNVYYAGLGFNRNSAPNTVTVNKGTFDTAGHLSWSAPTFINQTTSPSVFNDKEWIAADHYASSPYRDRVYVTWTRFIFNPQTGAYVESPIMFVSSSDGGKTFTAPQAVSGNAHYGQGSRPVVAPDGTLYVFWDGSTRLASYSSTYMVKSTDGGRTWSKPLAISPLGEILPLRDTAFRVNSFPAADVAPNGDLYAAWTTQVKDSAPQTGYGDPANFCGTNVGCHAAAVYSVSHDGGATWSTPAPIRADLDAANRTPVGDYTGAGITPDTHRVDTLWPGVSVSANGRVYLSAYAADVVSPWQSCKAYDPNGSVHCLTPGAYKNNAKLDYVGVDLTTGATHTFTAKPINTRYQFRGGFIGDYTQISAGSDGVVHALWTDTNAQQTINWWYGYNFNGLLANQQDAVTAAANF